MSAGRIAAQFRCSGNHFDSFVDLILNYLRSSVGNRDNGISSVFGRKWTKSVVCAMETGHVMASRDLHHDPGLAFVGDTLSIGER